MSPARSATLRPCLAVVLAAVALALAASRVLFWAVVRVRRPVVFDGDLAAVERQVDRRNNVVTQQVSTVSGRVEEAVQTGIAAGERVITNVQKQLA